MLLGELLSWLAVLEAEQLSETLTRCSEAEVQA